jgi:hypothetical protein
MVSVPSSTNLKDPGYGWLWWAIFILPLISMPLIFAFLFRKQSVGAS